MKFIIITLLIIGIWIGLVLGISFLEAPLKFKAPGITLKNGLSIGRLVFGASNKLQLILLFLLILTMMRHFYLELYWVMFLTLGLTVVMGFQSLYLLPLLDYRVEQILNDQEVPHSYDHILFVLLELLKVGLLIFLFIKIYHERH